MVHAKMVLMATPVSGQPDFHRPDIVFYFFHITINLDYELTCVVKLMNCKKEC